MVFGHTQRMGGVLKNSPHVSRALLAPFGLSLCCVIQPLRLQFSVSMKPLQPLQHPPSISGPQLRFSVYFCPAASALSAPNPPAIKAVQWMQVCRGSSHTTL